ncbi:MAG: sigma-70 family RNA polymerase sigma factor [Saprospiraceae bacterium]|nr:sigma-70 family RNA polymerase sigma factor [Saprospiraceae bacterium]
MTLLEITQTDRQLIQNCLSGDRDAQYKLYRTYAKAMYNICKRMVPYDADAEDVLQLSFIDVFSKLNSYKFESTPGAWIKRIVINNCINHLRKRRLETKEFDGNTDIVDEDHTEYEVNVQLIHKAIELLPDGYRIIFSLYAVEGYDHSEIAEILNITESTSKSQYSRARARLKEIIRSNGDINRIYH